MGCTGVAQEARLETQHPSTSAQRRGSLLPFLTSLVRLIQGGKTRYCILILYSGSEQWRDDGSEACAALSTLRQTGGPRRMPQNADLAREQRFRMS